MVAGGHTGVANETGLCGRLNWHDQCTGAPPMRTTIWAQRAGASRRSIRGGSTVAFLLAVAYAGCSADAEQVEVAASDWDQFGFGEKADRGACDAGGDFCWTTEDAANAKVIGALVQDVSLGVGDAQTALGMIAERARSLSHKLSADQIAAIADAEAAIAELGPQADLEEAGPVLQQLDEQVLSTLMGTFFQTGMVASSAGLLAADGAFDGPTPPVPDELTDDGMFDPDRYNNPHYSEGMRQSLQMFADQGPIAQLFLWVIEHSGVLERDYEVVNAETFGVYDAETKSIIPLGLSRHDRARQIVEDYRAATFWVGLGAGAISAVPIPGIGVVGVGYEMKKLFELHTRMALEIAAVYGWDIREGRTLFRVLGMLFEEGIVAEGADVLISNVLVMALSKQLAARIGGRVGKAILKEIAENMAERSIQALFGAMTRTFQRKLAEQAAKGGLKAAGIQLVGVATLGIGAFISGAADYVVTEMLGHRLMLQASQWVSDLMLEGATYMSRPRPQACAFEALATVAWSDGELTAREENLYQAFLAKPYNFDEQAWFYLEPELRCRYAAVLAEVGERAQAGETLEVPSCFDDQFRNTDSQHRMSLLAHVYAMTMVDTWQDDREIALYGSMREDMDGFWNGLNDSQMDYVERAVSVLMKPSVLDLGPEYQDLLEEVLPEDLHEYLAAPVPSTAAAYQVGMNGGSCDDLPAAAYGDQRVTF